MNKLSYGNYDSSITDIAFSATNQYSSPSSELEIRKQLSYPLKEVKTFVNNMVSVDTDDNAVQLVVSSDTIGYRTTPGGAVQDIDLTGGVELELSSKTLNVSDGTNHFNFKVLTEAQYNALGTKDQNTLYFIYEE